jgi:hypothetical protein
VRTRINDGRSVSARAADLVDVVAIIHRDCVPAVHFEAFHAIFSEGEISGRGERDVIVVVQMNQFAEFQMSRD